MKVSVIVPTHSRPALLERCLKALLAQRFDPEDFEIIVVDDAASAATRQQVQSIHTRLNPPCKLRYFSTRGNCGPAVARNIGWRAAESDIIAFTDDDTIP